MQLICDPKRLRVSLTSWKEKGIVHGFSTRRVPIAVKDFYERNSFDAAKEFCETLKISHQNLILPRQVHSSHIVSISDNILGRLKLFPDCDGLVSRSKKIALGILSADCLPLLFYAPTCQTIAVAHAGWRGIQKELPRKMVEHLIRFVSADPKDILVAIGPAIRVCCYEVKEDVARFFPENDCLKKDRKCYLDLVQVAKRQLQESGVQLDQISDTCLCTACRNEEFFSYRREGESAGRILSVIAYNDS